MIDLTRQLAHLLAQAAMLVRMEVAFLELGDPGIDARLGA
jgi:hypothetical protein